MKNNKGISLIALISTIICIIVLAAIIMEASTEPAETPQATIYVNDEYVTIDVSSYYIKNGIAYIIDSKGKEYISSNFTINKRWQVIVSAGL